MLYKTFEALRARVLEIINERSKGPAPMLHNCEEHQTEYEEEGEWLMRIENKNGQKKKIWTRVTAREAAKNGTGPECYRCGRFGHIRKDCRAKKHVNGGEPREFRKRGLNNLQTNDDDEVTEELAGLDICMLEETATQCPFKETTYIPDMPNALQMGRRYQSSNENPWAATA